MFRYSLALLMLLAAILPGWGEPPGPVPPQVAAYNPPPMAEQFRICVDNRAGGEIAVSSDQGATWLTIGQVLRWTGKVNPNGYTASAWAMPGSVAATAVNAIHLKTRNDPTTGRGTTFSLLPVEFAGPRETWHSFLSPDSSIYTDLPAGEGIFGSQWAPYVDDPVFVERAGQLVRLPPDYVPAEGDRLVIIVCKPLAYPKSITFDNVFGGLITLERADGTIERIGQVLKPVFGVGRFEGGVFTGLGRIRANHPGVIDVSVSRPGKIGGFQIIPAGHAMSPEMGNARRLTQWMVVGPLTAGEGAWEGVAPLFAYYLRPKYSPHDLDAPDAVDRLVARFLVEADVKGRGWGPLPIVELDPDLAKPLPESAFTALEGVQRIRILFPMHEGE